MVLFMFFFALWIFIEVCKEGVDMPGCWTACAYMSRLPGADMDLSSLLLGHSNGLLNDRFLSMAFTKI